MTKSNPYQDIEDLIPIATHFHGHLGPYLILGLKAGLAAIEYLGRDPFHTKAIITTKGFPPTSCFIDGIQLSTGCTLGKMNIEARRGEDLSALFTLNERTLRIKVKKETLKKVECLLSPETVERLALELAGRETEELFEFDKEDRL
jgi:formylmethanofuran dehydrogenase subunit E